MRARSAFIIADCCFPPLHTAVPTVAVPGNLCDNSRALELFHRTLVENRAVGPESPPRRRPQ